MPFFCQSFGLIPMAIPVSLRFLFEFFSHRRFKASGGGPSNWMAFCWMRRAVWKSFKTFRK